MSTTRCPRPSVRLDTPPVTGPASRPSGGAAYPLVAAGVVRLTPRRRRDLRDRRTRRSRAEGTIDKRVADGSPVQNADGTWTISYDIVVTNNSDTSTYIYSLSDTLEYGEGITPTAASWTGPDGTSGTFTLPTGTATLATGAALPTSGDPAARATHVYTVTVTASIANGTQDGETWRCDTTPGHALGRWFPQRSDAVGDGRGRPDGVRLRRAGVPRAREDRRRPGHAEPGRVVERHLHAHREQPRCRRPTGRAHRDASGGAHRLGARRRSLDDRSGRRRARSDDPHRSAGDDGRRVDRRAGAGGRRSRTR